MQTADQKFQFIGRLRELYRQGGVSAIVRGGCRFIHYNIQKPSVNKFRGGRAWWLMKRNGRYYQIDLEGYTMTVDLADPGISRDLALDGIREPISYETYRKQLGKLNDKQDDPVVVEIGANIGYYALSAVAEIPSANVYCAELSDDNVHMLQKNISLNSFESNFEVDSVAISDRTGEENAYMHKNSNCHSLAKKSDSKKKIHRVQTIRGDEWLKKYNIDEKDVDVLRLDIEGHESKALRGFSNIDPRLVHIEIHPTIMTDSEMDYVIERLQSWDLSVVTVADGTTKYSVTSLEELPRDEDVEVVLSDTK